MVMRFFNILFILLIGAIYFFWPELMAVEGFWFSIGAVWLCFFVSWFFFGDIADEIAGVNRYEDDEF
jgi:sterol desaturase/sphingolipid hydroxylase (fatty acid hydroxylase superfamily)